MAQQAKSQQVLPRREQELFKSICKHYENKAHKKGLKIADQILKVFPENGETLCMKGMLLYSLEPEDNKAAAEDMIKKGLAYNMKSYTSWHVLGLYHRAEKEYTQAIKCYRNAVRQSNDPTSVAQIKRDLGLLQVHTRDLAGFAVTRKEILTEYPSNLQNWIMYVVAEHMNGQISHALNVLDKYLEILTRPKEPQYEYSEQLLYKLTLLEEAGLYNNALDFVEANQNMIVDKLGVRQLKARLFLHTNKKMAEEIYRGLIETNTENCDYHQGLLASLSLDTAPAQPEQLAEYESKITALYVSLRNNYPKSHQCVLQQLLRVRANADFRNLLDSFLRTLLHKGSPTMYVVVKPLEKDKAKATVLEELVASYLQSVEQTGSLPGAAADSLLEAPSSVLWLLILLAHHHSANGRQETALALVERALAHTPTSLEATMCKARILRRSGDAERAAETFDQVRRMDLADRYINTRCTKYLMRANKPDQAAATINLFLKDSTDTIATMTEMQCMWFETELGKAYARMGDHARALKRLTIAAKHFEDFQEDQLDFHYYCFRKMTLNAYVQLLRNADNAYNHKFYRIAALSLAKEYLLLHDNPSLKAAPVAKKDDKEKKAAKQAAAKSKAPTDPDPDGRLLLQAADPLAEAAKYLRQLNEHHSTSLEVHLVGTDVYLRQAKYLLALRSVMRAVRAAGAEHPEVHLRIVQFCNAVTSKRAELPASVTAVIDGALPQLLPAGKTAVQVNDTFLAAHIASPLHVAAAARAAKVLGQSEADIAKILAHLEAVQLPKDEYADLQTYVDNASALAALKPEAGASFKARCAAAFPQSTFFNPPQPAKADAPAAN
eukprot:TRINITY_DN6730_c0_g1_i1.p1 TRINITY_DN6730_c0_g1~~TRINITY_DN6730_c0_g1_i1.p1  ORF type:complete len:863 (+),score=286.74 TRINITY_DN6730_c0_g1_i1:81-2591(+)